MIIVTGATGHLGSQIVGHLLDRLPAEQIGVSVRDVDAAGELAARGVRVRRGDYAEPKSLIDAFEGAGQVLVVSSMSTGEEALALHAAAIDAAVEAGAQRVLYTSHQAAAADSVFAPMPDHAATEQHLSRTGTPYTALRNGFYATSVPWLVGQAVQTGELVAPADGPVSWTLHSDLAEATAAVLAGQAEFDGPTPPLTGPQALDLDDVAAILSRLSGRTVRRVVADDDEYAATLAGHGVPAEQVAITLGLFRAARRGEFSTVGTGIADLLGRPATSIEVLLQGLVTQS